jgi:hypothetical protein
MIVATMLIVITIISYSPVYTKWEDRSDELPGMDSASDRDQK